MKLDLGCGKNKREGFLGVDIRPFEGVDVVFNLAHRISFPAECDPVTGRDLVRVPNQLDGYDYARWPWDDESVEEVHASHFVEHLTPGQRVHFVNELHRVLVPGGKATLITPYWGSVRAFGDLTHQWPPICEMWFYYLSKQWRAEQAPHNDFYTCDFEAVWAHAIHESLLTRSDELRSIAIQFGLNAVNDLHATLTKR